MTRLGIYLQDAHSISEAIEYAQYAESNGFARILFGIYLTSKMHRPRWHILGY